MLGTEVLEKSFVEINVKVGAPVDNQQWEYCTYSVDSSDYGAIIECPRVSSQSKN